MAGDADRDAVLAFLLGSTPSLDAGASSTAESVEAIEAVDDPPALEPVTDSDVEPETDVSAASATAEGAASSNNSDWDAITSGESEDETPSERQVTAPIAAETQQTEEQEEAPPAEQSAT
ncbi:hypothetical protein PHYPSEUDO_015200 [Phytophthora pseudosyringae]|uniref:Uncharacterized protein n=1 Tax=Phytophthora pseudosyringae TaxID=221518 RepID=A0A8T1W3V9_9STRA|nr:hypothetical protein PHYPSEUDO_015200 [Phytophthora pseudosyringae]